MVSPRPVTTLPWDGQISRLGWKSGDGCEPRRMTHGTNWPADKTLHRGTVGRAGIAYCGTSYAAAAQQSARQPSTRYQTGAPTREVVEPGIMPLITIMTVNHEELARRLKHEGIRAGEIIAYRAWRVMIYTGWFRTGDDRLHSVYMRDYVWHPDQPASGDVTTHGIYSFREVLRSEEQYGYHIRMEGPLVFGKIKIWGEVVEHEAGYRSEFAKIASLDYGDPELLDKFRKIYRVIHGDPVAR
jgi:hypothetical protein